MTRYDNYSLDDFELEAQKLVYPEDIDISSIPLPDENTFMEDFEDDQQTIEEKLERDSAAAVEEFLAKYEDSDDSDEDMNLPKVEPVSLRKCAHWPLPEDSSICTQSSIAPMPITSIKVRFSNGFCRSFYDTFGA